MRKIKDHVDVEMLADHIFQRVLQVEASHLPSGVYGDLMRELASLFDAEAEEAA